MPINYTQLASEINNDKVRDGTDGENAITVRRTDISAADVLEAIDVRDFDTTAPGGNFSLSWFESVTQLRSLQLIDEAGANTRILGNLRRILLNPGTQGSSARLDALANRFGSRAEQLFGSGTIITPEDVALALRPPPPQAARV